MTPVVTTPAVAVELESFVAWMCSWGASQQTIDARRKLAVQWFAQFGSPAETLTAENARTFLAQRHFSPSTRKTYYSHLRSMAQWLVETGRAETDPIATVRRPPTPRGVPRPLSDAELERVLATTTGRLHDWILLALLAGLRAHEIAKVRGEDVTPDGIYVMGKGGKGAHLPTHPDLWQMAQRYPRRGYWFDGRTDDGHITAR